MARRVRRTFSPAALACGLVLAAGAVPAGAASGDVDPAEVDAVVDAAIAFLADEQRADGGFGAAEAGFVGFETPDALLAIGAAAQAGDGWDAAAALAAAEAVQTGGNTGLSYLDDWADGDLGPISAGASARIAVVAIALGLDPTAFDPDGDGATDLLAAVAAGQEPDGSWGAGQLNATLWAVIAQAAAGLPVSPDTLGYLAAAQQANGGWDFAGDPDGAGEDADTTGLALVALRAAGVGPDDEVVERAIALLAEIQLDDGTWGEAFAADSNPSSTALAMLGLRAYGADLSGPCWRDGAVPGLAGEPYADPAAELVARAQPDGRIASPFDEFGVNTIATSQAVQALVPGFLPVDGLPVERCEVDGTSDDPNGAPGPDAPAPGDEPPTTASPDGVADGAELEALEALPFTGAPIGLAFVGVALVGAGLAARRCATAFDRSDR